MAEGAVSEAVAGSAWVRKAALEAERNSEKQLIQPCAGKTAGGSVGSTLEGSSSVSAHTPEECCLTLDDLPEVLSVGSELEWSNHADVHHLGKACAAKVRDFPKHRKIVGFEAGKHKYVTRYFSFFGRDRYWKQVKCKLDAAGSERCEIVQKERVPYLDEIHSSYEYVTLEALHKPQELVSQAEMDADQKYYKSQILEESRYQCAQKILAIKVIPREIGLDLSGLCYDVGGHVTCGGARKTEAEAQEINRVFHLDFSGFVREARRNKLHDIRMKNRDILEGNDDYYVMRACNFDEFLKRSGNDVYVISHEMYIDFDTYEKCKNPIEYQVIADTYYTLQTPGGTGYMIIDRPEELRKLVYYNFNSLDEDIIQEMDFNQYVLLYLTGGYIGEDAPKVKIREVCADAPVTAYIEGAFKSTADLGMLHRAKQFILVKVPKGAYRVHFVKAGKRVCFKP